MTGFLSLIIFAPLAGAAIIGLWPRLPSRVIRWTALIFTLISLALALCLFVRFDRAGGVQFEEYPQLKTKEGVAEVGNETCAWFKDPDGNILAVSQRLR